MDRHAVGRDAEERAVERVVAEGFRVLWRNARIGPLEIDLVAKKDDLAIIVEVRGRGSGAYTRPLASVTYAKRKMLLRAARGIWRGRLKKMPDVARVRIDVIAVTYAEGSPPAIEWIKGAVTDDAP